MITLSAIKSQTDRIYYILITNLSKCNPSVIVAHMNCLRQLPTILQNQISCSFKPILTKKSKYQHADFVSTSDQDGQSELLQQTNSVLQLKRLR